MAILLSLNFVMICLVLFSQQKMAIRLFLVILLLSLAMFIYQSDQPIRIAL